MKSAKTTAKKTVSNKKTLSAASKNMSKKKTGAKAKPKKTASAKTAVPTGDFSEENQDMAGMESMPKSDTMKTYMREIDL